MATGGEESELKSSTPTGSSGKRKASAVKSGDIRNVGEKTKKQNKKIKKLKTYFARSSEMFPRLASHAQITTEGF